MIVEGKYIEKLDRPQVVLICDFGVNQDLPVEHVSLLPLGEATVLSRTFDDLVACELDTVYLVCKEENEELYASVLAKHPQRAKFSVQFFGVDSFCDGIREILIREGFEYRYTLVLFTNTVTRINLNRLIKQQRIAYKKNRSTVLTLVLQKQTRPSKSTLNLYYLDDVMIGYFYGQMLPSIERVILARFQDRLGDVQRVTGYKSPSCLVVAPQFFGCVDMYFDLATVDEALNYLLISNVYGFRVNRVETDKIFQIDSCRAYYDLHFSLRDFLWPLKASVRENLSGLSISGPKKGSTGDARGNVLYCDVTGGAANSKNCIYIGAGKGAQLDSAIVFADNTVFKLCDEVEEETIEDVPVEPVREVSFKEDVLRYLRDNFRKTDINDLCLQVRLLTIVHAAFEEDRLEIMSIFYNTYCVNPEDLDESAFLMGEYLPLVSGYTETPEEKLRFVRHLVANCTLGDQERVGLLERFARVACEDKYLDADRFSEYQRIWV